MDPTSLLRIPVGTAPGHNLIRTKTPEGYTRFKFDSLPSSSPLLTPTHSPRIVIVVMKISPNSLRIGIAVAIIVGTIGWLAFTGYGANKSYYVTIAELGGMGDKAYHSQSARGGLCPARLHRAERHPRHVCAERV